MMQGDTSATPDIRRVPVTNQDRQHPTSCVCGGTGRSMTVRPARYGPGYVIDHYGRCER